jgi:hypothetical protein
MVLCALLFLLGEMAGSLRSVITTFLTAHNDPGRVPQHPFSEGWTGLDT